MGSSWSTKKGMNAAPVKDELVSLSLKVEPVITMPQAELLRSSWDLLKKDIESMGVISFIAYR